MIMFDGALQGDQVLPEKVYTVRVLSYGPVPDVAREYFAEKFPVAADDGRFFYPSTKIYRSISGAKTRASLLRFYGVECEVVSAPLDWAKHETHREYVSRLEREVAELRSRLGDES